MSKKKDGSSLQQSGEKELRWAENFLAQCFENQTGRALSSAQKQDIHAAIVLAEEQHGKRVTLKHLIAELENSDVRAALSKYAAEASSTISKVFRQQPDILIIGSAADEWDSHQFLESVETRNHETPPEPPQRRRLVELMKAHNLTAKATGELLGRSERTVLIWRCQGGKEIPAVMLELLELKLSKGDV